MPDNQTLKRMFEAYLKQAQNAPFSGWDFEFIRGRMVEAPLKWNYYNVVLPWISKAKTMLDMGTGGGEVLSEFQPLPPRTYATEQYQPNVSVARGRLEPLGVRVVEIEEEKNPPFNANLPFDVDFFDLIINRHEAYYPPELMRILKPGGLFVTQQVGNLSMLNLKQFLLGKSVTVSNWNLKSAVDELKSAGFEIVQQQEDIQYCRFYDVGAVVFLLKAIPWTIEGFSVAEYRDKLWELHVSLSEAGYYDTPQHRFLVVARKNSVKG